MTLGNVWSKAAGAASKVLQWGWGAISRFGRRMP